MTTLALAFSNQNGQVPIWDLWLTYVRLVACPTTIRTTTYPIRLRSWISRICIPGVAFWVLTICTVRCKPHIICNGEWYHPPCSCSCWCLKIALRTITLWHQEQITAQKDRSTIASRKLVKFAECSRHGDTVILVKNVAIVTWKPYNRPQTPLVTRQKKPRSATFGLPDWLQRCGAKFPRLAFTNSLRLSRQIIFIGWYKKRFWHCWQWED